jgi:hypothetical protein
MDDFLDTRTCPICKGAAESPTRKIHHESFKALMEHLKPDIEIDIGH